jgi:glycosyltransferase involved in cell wall biosynthesis
VPSGDVAAFAAAIRRLLDDAPTRLAMGRAAHDRASWFSWEATADSMSDLLEHTRRRHRGAA